MFFIRKRKCLLTIMLLSFTFYTYAETDLEQLFNSKRYEEFFTQAEIKAKEKDKTALFLLGKAYHLGLGVEKDINKAGYYYYKASVLGDARADNNIGLVFEESGNRYRAMEHFQQAFTRGLKMPTLRNLARICQENIRVSLQPYIKRVKECEQYHEMLYQEDSSKHNLHLLSQMKTLTFLKTGDEEAKEEALQWLDKAIAQGGVEAITNKGIVFEVADNKEQVRTLFEQAANKEQPLALYKMGLYSKPNSFESVEWFGKAASFGSLQAFYKLERIAEKFGDSSYTEEPVNFTYKQWEEVLSYLQKYIAYINTGKPDSVTKERLSSYNLSTAESAYKKLKDKLDASKQLDKYLIDRKKNKPSFTTNYKVKIVRQLKSFGYIDRNVNWRITSSTSLNDDAYTLLKGVSSNEGTVEVELTKPENVEIIKRINQGDFLFFKHSGHSWLLTYEVKDNTIYLISDLELAKLINRT